MYEVGDIAAVLLVSSDISDHVEILSHRLTIETLDVSTNFRLYSCNIISVTHLVERDI